MKLSRNFWLSEFTKSQTAIRRGISNEPTEEHLINLKNLVQNVLQPLREHFDDVVSVSSGYRSEALNEAIGGSKRSQHSKGQAADFEIYGTSNYEVAKWIQDNLEFDQLILEFYDYHNPNSGWIHCSFNKDHNRRQVLTASKVNQRTVYQEVIL